MRTAAKRIPLNLASAALILILAVLATGAMAQIPGLAKSAEAAPEPASDPMGRTTPRGAIVQFSRTVERHDFVSAARYLQLDAAQRKKAAKLADTLNSLFDRAMQGSIANISDSPTGALDDGLPEDRERVGPLIIDDQEAYITLVRVPDIKNGHIWLISSETLRAVEAYAAAAGESWIERVMPAPLVQSEFLGVSLAHWIVLVCQLGGIFVLLMLIGTVCNLTARKVIPNPERLRVWDAWYQATRWQAIAALTILSQFLVIPTLGLPLSFRVIYGRVALIVLAIAMIGLLRRGLSLAFAHARGMVRGKDRASTQSLMLLAERMIQAVIVVIGGIAVLVLLGVESKTALAGLGVVGVALALGAQKTVENLLGGIFLLSDKALAVGDYCTIQNQSGWIEDVTLRSVRMRTVNQTLVSFPAGSLAQAGIENFSTRRKMAIDTTLRLRYGTSAAQLKRIISDIRALLEANPKFEIGSTYVRLKNFGVDAVELELYAYVLTRDSGEYGAVREELLLEIATRVEAAGSGLAPTRFVQLQQAQDAAAAKPLAEGRDAAVRDGDARNQ